MNDQELTAALQNQEIEARIRAIAEVEQKQDSRFIQTILKLLGDSEWRVRKTAVSALIQLKRDSTLSDALIDLLQSPEENMGRQNAVVESLIGIGSPAVPSLIRALPRVSKETKKFIVDVLGEIGDKTATACLMETLSDEDENVKLAVVEALGKLKDSRAVESLIVLLGSENHLLGYASIKALERIQDSRAVEPIVSVLGKKLLERAGLEALGQMGDLRALNPIVMALHLGQKKIKESAIKALVSLHDRLSLNTEVKIISRLREVYSQEISLFLMEAIETSDEKTQLAAIIVLGWLGEAKAAKGVVKFLDGPFQDEAIATLVNMKREAVEPLLQEIPTANEKIRQGIAKVFGVIGNRRAVLALVKLLSDPNGHVRQEAVIALGKLKDPICARALLGLLQDEYPSVQEAAIQVLSSFKQKELMFPAFELLSNPTAALRCNGIKLLGKLMIPEAIPRLILCLKDESPEVRGRAVEALGYFKSNEVDNHLIHCLADENPSVRLATLSLLMKRRTEDLLSLIEPLMETSGYVQRLPRQWV